MITEFHAYIELWIAISQYRFGHIDAYNLLAFDLLIFLIYHISLTEVVPTLFYKFILLDEARICVKHLHGVDEIRADEAIEYNRTTVQSDEAIEYNRTIVQSNKVIVYSLFAINVVKLFLQTFHLPLLSHHQQIVQEKGEISVNTKTYSSFKALLERIPLITDYY